MSRLQLILKILFAYITIAGLITFSLFICQEASQTVMFGTWPAKDTQQWHLVLEGADLMAKINFIEKIINYCVGWIQPLAFFAYRSHTQSIDYYVKVTKAQIFAHEPQLLIGRYIEFDFRPRQIKHLEDGRYLAANRKIGVYVDKDQKLDLINVKGYAKRQGHLVIIDSEK